MEFVKKYSYELLFKKIFGKNVRFKSDCEFFPNFDIIIKVKDLSLGNNEILIKGITKNNKSITIGSNMQNLEFEIM